MGEALFLNCVSSCMTGTNGSANLLAGPTPRGISRRFRIVRGTQPLLRDAELADGRRDVRSYGGVTGCGS